MSVALLNNFYENFQLASIGQVIGHCYFVERLVIIFYAMRQLRVNFKTVYIISIKKFAPVLLFKKFPNQTVFVTVPEVLLSSVFVSKIHFAQLI